LIISAYAHQAESHAQVSSTRLDAEDTAAFAAAVVLLLLLLNSCKLVGIAVPGVPKCHQ
jgi:hypothetical protein